MFELLDWLNQIRADLPELEKRALEDAEEQKTFGKAKKYVNQQKIDLSDSFHATAMDQIDILQNAIIEDVIADIQKEFNHTEIPHHDRKQ